MFKKVLSWGNKKARQIGSIFKRADREPRQADRTGNKVDRQVSDKAGKLLETLQNFKEATEDVFKVVRTRRQVVQPCQAARQDGPHCDVSRLTITQEATGRKVSFDRAELTNKDQVFPPGDNVLEVVAAKGKEVSVTAQVTKHLKYCGKKGHPLLIFDPMHHPARTFKDATGDKVLKVGRRGRLVEGDLVPDSFWMRVWEANLPPNVFAITARACGCRPDGGTPTRELPGEVHVYPGDQFELGLTLPTCRTVSVQCKGEWKGRHTRRFTDRKGEASPKPRPGLTLTRNGAKDPGAVRLEQIVNTVLQIKQLVEQIRDTVLSLKVKVGWYFDMDYTLLDGGIWGTWGWQEHRDNRVFFGYGLHAKLTLLDFKASVGFGIEVSAKGDKNKKHGVTATVQGSIKAHFRLDARIEHTSPDSLGFDDSEGRITGSCSASLSAHVVVGSPDYFEIHGEVETGLDLEGGLTVSKRRGFGVDASARWTGVMVTGNVRIMGCGLWRSEHRLLEGKDLGSWQYPPTENADLSAPTRRRK